MADGVLRYDEIHPAIRGALGMFEGLRKIGFQATDIYAATRDNGEEAKSIMVVLRAQGKEHITTVGEMSVSEDDFRDIWEETCLAVNSRLVPPKDYQRIYRESLAYTNAGDLLFSLHRKGIVPPLSDRASAARLN